MPASLQEVMDRNASARGETPAASPPEEEDILSTGDDTPADEPGYEDDEAPNDQDEPSDATPAAATPAEKAILESLKAKGLDLADKYGSDEEAIKGLQNLIGVVGKRNEDAERWHAFLDAAKGYEAEIQELLSGKKKAVAEPQLPAGVTETEMLKSYDEYRLLEKIASEALDADGKPKPGVDVAALQRLSKTADRMGRMLFDLASDPEKVLGPVFQKLRDQLTAETQQFVHSQGQQQQAEEAMNHVWASHADLVVDKTDRTKLSAAGQRVMERYGHLVNELGAKASPATLQDAIDYVKSMTPAPRPTKQPSKSALHAPAMAEEAAGKKTDLKERFRKGMTDGSKFGIVELMDERLRLRKQAT